MLKGIYAVHATSKLYEGKRFKRLLQFNQIRNLTTFLLKMLSINFVPDLRGKVVIVTGATSGIGLEAARIFAKRRAKLILACIEEDKMADVASALKVETPDADIIQMQIDVGDLVSVHDFVQRFSKLGLTRIDVLLLNAGIAEAREFKPSAQGYELTFATNHLGHWLLTGMLLRFMKDVPDSRIVVVSSMAHSTVKQINYPAATGDDPRQYSPNNTYAQTKLANHLFVTKLNTLLADSGAKTIAVPAHPGVAATSLLDGDDLTITWKIILLIFTIISQSAADGALPILMAATDPAITRDSYYGPRHYWEFRGPPFAHAKKSQTATDPKKADELWSVSEQLCGFAYSL